MGVHIGTSGWRYGHGDDVRCPQGASPRGRPAREFD